MRKGTRITVFDTLRGFTVLSMVAFHVTYDLAYLYGIKIPWYTVGPFQEIWRSSISWTFLFLAGWMTNLSRNNIKRAGAYAIAAITVYAATSLASVDTPVSYGIIFCMTASTLLFEFIKKPLERVPPLLGCMMCFTLFLITNSIPQYVYDIPHIAWLGFPDAGFTSGDYYPLIPYFFMYVCGSFAAKGFLAYEGGTYPTWMYRDICHPLTWLGTQSLLVYLVHQPLALLTLSIIFGH